MTTFDLSPLFRTSVGFDRLARMLNTESRLEQGGGFPPYNIKASGEDKYEITMAVAGFSESDLEITSEQNRLVVSGNISDDRDSEQENYLYRGIATRSFERRFNLADHVKVSGARLDNGLLHIDLEREIPEEMKPKSIEIQSGSKLIENKKSNIKAA
jgi:molecular chaperone IbpA